VSPTAKGRAAARALFEAMDGARGHARASHAHAPADGAGDPRQLGAGALVKPAWPSDRRTFASLGLQCVVNAFVYSTYVARLPDIRDEAGLWIAAMGVVMTVGNLAGLGAMLPSAALIRRWGSKRVMVVSSVAYVLTLPLLGSSTSPTMLVAAVVAMMVTNALVDVAVAMQSATFSSRRHYPAMSPG
jgi:MFS family permease